MSVIGVRRRHNLLKALGKDLVVRLRRRNALAATRQEYARLAVELRKDSYEDLVARMPSLRPKLIRIFREHDWDNSGTLDRTEFAACLKSVNIDVRSSP